MPVVPTAKKNTPSNRPSRLRTAWYLVSSSITRPVCARRDAPGWRDSDTQVGRGAVPAGRGRRRCGCPARRPRSGPAAPLDLHRLAGLGVLALPLLADLRTQPRVLLGDHAQVLPLQLAVAVQARSEEHTSELQSRENLVCRL